MGGRFCGQIRLGNAGQTQLHNSLFCGTSQSVCYDLNVQTKATGCSCCLPEFSQPITDRLLGEELGALLLPFCPFMAKNSLDSLCRTLQAARWGCFSTAGELIRALHRPTATEAMPGLRAHFCQEYRILKDGIWPDLYLAITSTTFGTFYLYPVNSHHIAGSDLDDYYFFFLVPVYEK